MSRFGFEQSVFPENEERFYEDTNQYVAGTFMYRAYGKLVIYRVFSHDVTAPILVFQNNETAAMLVSQTSPVGVELFSYVNAFFCSNKFA